ncbi:5-hydroxytryptamine receptor 3A-like [Pelodytes ibericus]
MEGYNKWVRPVYDWKQTTTVYLDIIVYAILGVDEKNQMLTTYIWYNQSWVDEFLSWDPLEYDNITVISFSTQKIWTPDICILQAVDIEKSLDVPYVYIKHYGKIFNNKPIEVVTSCALNIYYFPFDVQNCTLTFTSWIHTTDDINVSIWRSEEEIMTDKSIFVNTGEWELLYVQPHYTVFEGNDLTFGEISFSLIIKRRPLLYVVNLILPSMFLMVMDLFGYYLPAESGERISFKITLLLGYSVFLIIVADTLPSSTVGTPLIDVYFIVCMALLLVSLMESIFIVRIVHKQHLHHLPEWLKKLVLEKITILLCMRNSEELPVSKTNSSDTSWQMDHNYTEKLFNHNNRITEDCKTSGDEIMPTRDNLEILNEILKETISIRNFLETTSEHKTTIEWLQIAYILDTLLFRIYFTAVLTYIITLSVMWCNWMQA